MDDKIDEGIYIQKNIELETENKALRKDLSNILEIQKLTYEEQVYLTKAHRKLEESVNGVKEDFLKLVNSEWYKELQSKVKDFRGK